MLDTSLSAGNNDGIGSRPSTNKCDVAKLGQRESVFLQTHLGMPLAALVQVCTESPVMQIPESSSCGLEETKVTTDCVATKSYTTEFLKLFDRFRSMANRFICRSYTIRLIVDQLVMNHRTHRLRALLPTQLVDDTVVTIDRAFFQTVIHTTSRMSHRSSKSLSHRHIPSTDPSLVLLGSIHLLFLLLSLLIPLRSHMVSSVSNEATDLLDPCVMHNRGQVSFISGESESVFVHSVDDLNCTHFDASLWSLFPSSGANETLKFSLNLVGDFMQNLFNSTLLGGSNQCWFGMVKQFISYFTCLLANLLTWLESGQPAGLKINIHMARLLGHFFLYHLLAWRAYNSFLLYGIASLISYLQVWTQVFSLDEAFYSNLYTSMCIILSTLYLSSTSLCVSTHSTLSDSHSIQLGAIVLTYISAVLRLTLALICSLVLDVLVLMTIHLSTFYGYALKLLTLQLRTIAAAWRLCRNASKWNPLRKRVDTVPDMYTVGGDLFVPIKSTSINDETRTNYSSATEMSCLFVERKHDIYLDRLFVGTLFGLAVGLCLLPTTFAFYLTFSMIRLVVVTLQNLLKRAIVFVMDVPLSTILAWLLHWKRSRTNLVVHAPINQPFGHHQLMQIKLVRPDFHTAYENGRLLRDHDILDPILSFKSTLWYLCSMQQI